MFDLFGTGTETTSSSMAFVVLYGLHHPQVVDRLRADVDRVVGRKRKPSLEDRQQVKREHSQTRLLRRGNPTNIASVHLVMGCLDDRAGVKIVGEKNKTLRATYRSTQISTPSLITTSGAAVGVALVIPILVGNRTRPHNILFSSFLLPPSLSSCPTWKRSCPRCSATPAWSPWRSSTRHFTAQSFRGSDSGRTCPSPAAWYN